ncbi:MAG TPA: hypothetical protein VMU25_00205 [Candidatus Paceibacterota bacterium]|nr:hypothetical protein [Candidatus Paceibacterota bacterium]
MARTSTYGVAVRFAIALVAALALGSLFAGSVAHADTWMSSSSQSWGHSNDNHNWNNGGNNNWNHGSNNNWGHTNNGNHGNHDWWRWHRVGNAWQQYFDWTLYCQWAAQTYGYVSPQCAAYVTGGMGY